MTILSEPFELGKLNLPAESVQFAEQCRVAFLARLAAINEDLDERRLIAYEERRDLFESLERQIVELRGEVVEMAETLRIIARSAAGLLTLLDDRLVDSTDRLAPPGVEEGVIV
jgi:hypothetical protein